MEPVFYIDREGQVADRKQRLLDYLLGEDPLNDTPSQYLEDLKKFFNDCLPDDYEIES
jgi:hypothetical protein